MSLRRLASLWGPVVAFVVLEFVLSSRSGLPIVRVFWDKLLHVAGYAVFGALCLRAFHGGVVPLAVRPTLGALALTLLYGVADEIHQSFVPGRDGSWEDVLADGIGFGLAALLVHVRCRVFPAAKNEAGPR